MAKQSAGILLYRITARLEVFLVHPGGPFFKNKDLGSWTIPKGELGDNENPLDAAKREFLEETGQAISGDFIALESITQKGGKEVLAWALESDVDASKCVSNFFEIEWPPRSGSKKRYPEVDKFEWYSADDAKAKINVAQVNLIEQLEKLIAP